MPEAHDELYELCRSICNSSEKRYEKAFKQDELLELCKESESANLQSIVNVQKLLPLITRLCADAMFITMKAGTACWAVRPKKAAIEVSKLAVAERMVYEVIESSYEQGIWIRMIKNKTGIKDGHSIDKVIKKLQNANLIQTVQNAKAASQKTYMLSYLAPSDQITGGSFFDAGKLDESLVDEVGNIIIFHVLQASWGQEKRKRVKQEPVEIEDDEDPTESRGRKKRKSANGTVLASNDIEDSARKVRSHKPGRDPEVETEPVQLAFPIGHSYPTATSIHNFIVASGVLRGGKANSLTVQEIQNVINVLIWDDKLEEINGGYRTIRGVKPQHPGMDEEEATDGEIARRGNGLTEAPCARCPVFDVCGTGGLVSAVNCVYYTDWLNGVSTKASVMA